LSCPNSSVSRDLRLISGTNSWRKLHSEELYKVLYSMNITRLMEDMRNAFKSVVWKFYIIGELCV
jgi:hypothetical protein